MSIISVTREMARDREHEVLFSLGIAPPQRGHMRCPLGTHPDRNPSWRWDYRTGRYYCTCGSGDILDVVFHVAGLRDLGAAAGYVCDVLGLPSPGQRHPKTPAEIAASEARVAEVGRHKEEREARRAFARKLWAGSLDADRTPAEAYLRSRGITCSPPARLGFLESYGKERLPAMIAAFGLPTEPEPGELRIEADAVKGVHLTFLKADGSGKAKNAEGKEKIMLGRGHSMPIVLAPPNDGLGLLIAEGIEDALSGHEATGLGAWAAGSANRLPGLAKHVPGYVESVTIVEDDNSAGRENCSKLADALSARRIEVLIERAEEAGNVAA